MQNIFQIIIGSVVTIFLTRLVPETIPLPTPIMVLILFVISVSTIGYIFFLRNKIKDLNSIKELLLEPEKTKEALHKYKEKIDTKEKEQSIPEKKSKIQAHSKKLNDVIYDIATMETKGISVGTLNKMSELTHEAMEWNFKHPKLPRVMTSVDDLMKEWKTFDPSHPIHQLYFKKPKDFY